MSLDRKRIQKELDQVYELLKEEDVSAARQVLSQIEPNVGDAAQRFDLKLLEIRIYLIERKFGIVQASLHELRRIHCEPAQLQSLTILDAYCKALAGEGRRALSLIAPISREVGPFHENYAEAAYIIGLCLLRRGHYAWARRRMEQAVAYHRLTRSAIDLSRMLNSLALLEKSAGQINLALRYLDEATRILPPGKYARHRRRLLTNRAVCLLRVGQARNAIVCLSEARSIVDGGADAFVDISICNNLGHAYRMCGDYNAAGGCFLKALEDSRAVASPRQECLALEFLGELLLETGAIDEAADYLERARIQAMNLAPQGDLMMEVLRRRGELKAAQGKKEEAAADLERAIQLCGSRGETRERVLAERALALVRSDAGAFAEAVSRVLRDIKAIGDRFEYVRTIYLVLKKGRKGLLEEAWFQEAVVIATYYAEALGVDYWRQRLREVVGHARSVVLRTPEAQVWASEVMIESRSNAFVRCLDAARLAARSDCAALIVGETGVGKEVVAKLVHEQSARATGPLVAINCGALPEALVESELFGHARGTFTGAHKDKEGLFEFASGGTVLLDEIGDLPAHTQIKLLRFLDTGEFRRLGETRMRQADVRVLAATNRDLRGLVNEGKFREDLLFRLNVFQIDVPPLRTRREDVLALAEFFLEQACRPGMGLVLSAEVAEWLEKYDWPGNVREMKNLCQYLAAKAWGRSEVRVDDLPEDLLQRVRASAIPGVLSRFERQRLDLERDQIVEALRQSEGRILHAAKLLGMSRNTLATRMRELGVERGSCRS